MKTATHFRTHLLVLAALAASVSGCKSTTNVDASADQSEHNRMLVRMAMAENVYNGVAAEGAVYSKDFDYGSATLNTLGERRVATLIHAYRGGGGKVVVLQGEESDETYAKRIDAVRKQFADAGFNNGQVEIGRGTLTGGSSSERGIVSFDRMMSSYRAPAAAAAGVSDNQLNNSFSK
jgi:hypothetical protein